LAIISLIFRSAPKEHEGGGVAFAALIVALCLDLALNFWFYTIIYRAYKFMKEEKEESWDACTCVVML
jgi:hypothetical protein